MKKWEYKRWKELPATQCVLKMLATENNRFQELINNGVPFISQANDRDPVFEYGRCVGALYGLEFLDKTVYEYLQDDKIEEDED